jgi:hypothetical protein
MQRCTTTRESKSRESQELGQCFFSNQFAWLWMLFVCSGKAWCNKFGS